MAYIYLLNLYETIDQRIDTIQQTVGKIPKNSEELYYLEGRVQALSGFKEFLLNNLNHKLPKKIRRQIKKS